MRQGLCILLLMAVFALARAQQNYDVSLIPKGLLTHANSVVRDEETNIEVKDLGVAVEHVKEAVTVLNTNGDRQRAHCGLL